MEIGKSLGLAARRRPKLAKILLVFMPLMESGFEKAMIGIGWIFIAACAWWYFIWLLPPSKLKYSNLYDVPYASVTMPSKPHDCEFLTAPMGEKHCSYEVEVMTVQTKTSTTGKPIVSFDGGKSWKWDDGNFPATPSVQVSWKKIEE